MTEPAPRELSPTDALRLDRLRRALVEVRGFQLFLLEVPPGALRDVAVARVLAWSGQGGVPRLERLEIAPTDDVDQVLLARGAQGGLVAIGLDDARHSDVQLDRALGALNWSRDQLIRKLAGPLVLVLSPRGVARLLAKAPDLASTRGQTCRIGAGDEEPDGHPDLAPEVLEAQAESPEQLLLRAPASGNVSPRLPRSLASWLAAQFPTEHDVSHIVAEAEALIASGPLPPSQHTRRLRTGKVPMTAGALRAWQSAIRDASAISPRAILAILLAARTRSGPAPILEDAIQAALDGDHQ